MSQQINNACSQIGPLHESLITQNQRPKQDYEKLSLLRTMSECFRIWILR